MENTYDNCGWIADEFFVKREKIQEYADFFKDYELANLIEYEQFINDYLDECSKKRKKQKIIKNCY